MHGAGYSGLQSIDRFAPMNEWPRLRARRRRVFLSLCATEKEPRPRQSEGNENSDPSPVNALQLQISSYALTFTHPRFLALARTASQIASSLCPSAKVA